MLNPDKTPRQYRLIDPDKLDTEDVGPPIPGTNADCLADGILDVIQVGLASGMTLEDVDTALRKVQDVVATQERFKFRLHLGNSDKQKS